MSCSRWVVFHFQRSPGSQKGGSSLRTPDCVQSSLTPRRSALAELVFRASRAYQELRRRMKANHSELEDSVNDNMEPQNACCRRLRWSARGVFLRAVLKGLRATQRNRIWKCHLLVRLAGCMPRDALRFRLHHRCLTFVPPSYSN